jgi:hypothetical protein
MEELMDKDYVIRYEEDEKDEKDDFMEEVLKKFKITKIT